jgi:DNA-binding response OmpR family regulator
MKGRLLIVDGNKSIREQLCSFLCDKGYYAVLCGGFEDAWILLQCLSFDIAIADFFINKDSGKDFCRYLASSRKELPSLIITTSRQSLEIERHIRGFSPVYYFIKPCLMEDIYSVIVKTMEYRNRDKQASRCKWNNY